MFQVCVNNKIIQNIDKVIVEYILYDLEDKKNIQLMKYLKGSIEEANNCLYKNHAMEYLSNYLSITGYPKEMLLNKIYYFF